MKKSSLKSKEEIRPYAIYKTEEVARFLGVNPQAVRDNKNILGGKRLGKSFVFLGENILSYLGSPSIARMKPNDYSNKKAS